MRPLLTPAEGPRKPRGMSRVSVTIALGFAALFGCRSGEETVAPRTPTPLDLTATGTIHGVVRLVGDPPAGSTVRMSSAADCASQHPEDAVPVGDVLVHEGRVENAFVYIKEGLGERVFAVPTEPVVIDNKGCLYAPRVVGAQVGQAVRFVNEDPLLHNIHGTPAVATSWNFSLPRRGVDKEIHVSKPEVMIPLRCDVHPWMKGFLGVVDHPYHRLTDPSGEFTLTTVPAGTYQLEVWHERLGTRVVPVTVAAQGTAEVAVAFGASAN